MIQEFRRYTRNGYHGQLAQDTKGSVIISGIVGDVSVREGDFVDLDSKGLVRVHSGEFSRASFARTTYTAHYDVNLWLHKERTATTDFEFGIVLRELNNEPDTKPSTGVVTHTAGKTVSILRQGVIYLEHSQGNVLQGEKLVLNKVTGDIWGRLIDAATQNVVTNVSWEESGTDKQVLRARISII